MQLLSPLANRLEALKQNQTEGRLEPTLAINTTLLQLATVAKLAARKNKFLDLERFNRTRNNYLS